MSEALNRIIQSKRMPVLFIGSGISRRYLKDFPNWEELLERLRVLIKVPPHVFEAHRQELCVRDPEMTQGKLYQKMASCLRDTLLEKLKTEKLDPQTLFSAEEYEKCTRNGVDFFKLLAAKQLTSWTLDESRLDEIALFRKISEKVSMVFTTNFDCFLQKEIFGNFKVYESQDKYYFRTSSGFGEIFKIHGCVQDPDGIILCEEDFERFDSALKLVSSKLLNALLDFPIIFIGYSLNDENIQKLLADFVGSFSGSILQEVQKFMLFVSFKPGETALKEGIFTTEHGGRSITFPAIQTDNFAGLFEMIDRLTPGATAYELRKYKSMVARLIQDTSRGSQRAVYVQELDSAKADQIALYIGKRDNIEGMKSVVSYSKEEVLQMVLEEQEQDWNEFARRWFEEKNIIHDEYTPVFFIHHRITLPFEECGSRFRKNYEFRKNSFMEFTPKPSKSQSIKEITQKYEEFRMSGMKVSKIAYQLHLELSGALADGKITVDESLELLRRMAKENAGIVNMTHFKQILCYTHFLKYEKNRDK